MHGIGQNTTSGEFARLSRPNRRGQVRGANSCQKPGFSLSTQRLASIMVVCLRLPIDSWSMIPWGASICMLGSRPAKIRAPDVFLSYQPRESMASTSSYGTNTATKLYLVNMLCRYEGYGLRRTSCTPQVSFCTDVMSPAPTRPSRSSSQHSPPAKSSPGELPVPGPEPP